jgi:7,8-dihydropterin-6-yl-methyl-4-(beta-D-ribofuranosyl)aminobenzene 5'-phosphate synthase
MKILKVLLAGLVAVAIQMPVSGQGYRYPGNAGELDSVNAESGITSPVTVTVIYDNYVHTDGMTADWGYSIVIGGLDKTILFDTGTRPETFRSNFEKSGVDPSSVDIVVLSHEHGDHLGGLPAFAQMRTPVPVVIPRSFSASVTSGLASSGYKPILVKGPGMICNNLYTSGVFDYHIPEQCLVLDTRDGLVVMTGCSHPGIVEMLTQIREEFGKNIFSVFGGFHLMNISDRKMEEIIAGMKELGVVRCGATHCTGDRQIELFRKAFGDNYFDLGVGNMIVIN